MVRRALHAIACAAVGALVAGCAGIDTRTLHMDPTQGRSERVFFPGAPEVPRYLYAGQLIGEGNYVDENGSQSKMKSLLGWIAGLAGEAAPEGLQRPQSGLTEANGRVLVTDGSRGAVLAFDPVHGLEIWEQASGLTKFATPVGIAESPEGRIFVADADLGYVAELDAHGKPVAVIGKDVLHRPTGVAYDPATRRLFVTDTPVHDIKIFDGGGKLLGTLGQRGEGDGEFNFPTHLAFARGELYVADTMNSRVQIFADGERHRATLGTRGVFLGNMVRPKGISVDSEGNIYVVESYYDHLLIYDRKGNFLLPIGGLGKDVGQFYLPAGAWTDANNRIFVADMFNGRVVVLQFLGGGAESEQ